MSDDHQLQDKSLITSRDPVSDTFTLAARVIYRAAFWASALFLFASLAALVGVIGGLTGGWEASATASTSGEILIILFTLFGLLGSSLSLYAYTGWRGANLAAVVGPALIALLCGTLFIGICWLMSMCKSTNGVNPFLAFALLAAGLSAYRVILIRRYGGWRP